MITQGNHLMKRIATLLVVVFSLGCAGLAQAGDFDGSRSLLCAPGHAVNCVRDDACSRVSPSDINLPNFITVDFDAKTLSGTPIGGAEATTEIQNVHRIDGKTIIQGAEGGRGWTMLIDQATGQLSAAVADQHDGFVLFGACTPK